ncbi:hypothetical protein DKX38_000437 [Salix brachista]|uniref:Leucine-rich repeat-containing N-terminal plant-type domain-containing protein n=1 Tax=Salix brachista TaxID=2182728 RepID=A0A5N5P2D8_9ROSI|nr:hypothetical protein DKX38_000437 [Salix brachista]
MASLGCTRVLICLAEKDGLRPGLFYYEPLRKSGWSGEMETAETGGEGHVFHLGLSSHCDERCVRGDFDLAAAVFFWVTVILSTMASRILACLLFAVAIATVDCNLEGDALYSWKTQLLDPNSVLQSWDPTLVNPCTWFHVTCNSNNSLTRVDLGNAGLSGPLIPELGLLANLQYLEVFGNNISGTIPTELGNLTKLVSLDLYHNKLSGPIPTSLGNLGSLSFMRLHGNKLTGTIPASVISLITTGRLRILNVSNNLLSGTVHRNNSTGKSSSSLPQYPNLDDVVTTDLIKACSYLLISLVFFFFFSFGRIEGYNSHTRSKDSSNVNAQKMGNAELFLPDATN